MAISKAEMHKRLVESGIAEAMIRQEYKSSPNRHSALTIENCTFSVEYLKDEKEFPLKVLMTTPGKDMNVSYGVGKKAIGPLQVTDKQLQVVQAIRAQL